MLGSGFRKARDTAVRKHAAELAQHCRRIRHMMKSVQAENAINRGVCEIDPLTIKEQKLGRGSPTGGRVKSGQLAAKLPFRGSGGSGEHLCTQLRKKNASPTRTQTQPQPLS